jgi:hypothetical protein
MGYSGAGGKLINEKPRSKKSRDTVPLKICKIMPSETSFTDENKDFSLWVTR